MLTDKITDKKISKTSVECSVFQVDRGDRNIEYNAEVNSRDGKYTVNARSYKSEKKAKDLLGLRLSHLALQYERAEKNGKRAVFVCGTGEIIVVSWKFESWEYVILREGETHVSSCMSNWTSLDAVCESVKSHAAQSYGGVRWTMNF